MSVGVRIITWAIEMCLGAVCLSGIVSLMAHANASIGDIAFFSLSTLVFFGMSGYAETTLIVRILSKGRWLSFYPITAALLFQFHFEVLNRMTSSGTMDAPSRAAFRAFGAVVVIIVSAASSFFVGRVALAKVRPGEQESSS